LNQGLRLAQGKWLTCVGQFDRLTPDALQQVIQHGENAAPDLLFFDEEIIDRDCNRIRIWHKKPFGLEYSGTSDPLGSSLFIRRELARQLGGFDPELDGAHLFALAFRALCQGAILVHGQAVTYQRRQLEPPSDAENTHVRNCVRIVLQQQGNRQDDNQEALSPEG